MNEQEKRESQMVDENNFMIDFEQEGDLITQNQSVSFDKSKVEFKKIGVVIDKSGAKKQDLSNITMDIDVDCIQEVRKIGKGSAGDVFLSTYSCNGQKIDVAVKQIPVDQKQSRDQFVQDLKVFLTSSNPNVVKFYGCYYKQGYLSEVIEYMNMGSLRDMINFNIKFQFLLPIQEVLAEISFCILSGLNYIHKQKHQIHRDIKPQNILINSNGEVKITDFGICKQLQKTYGLSKTCVGTQIYMSPERVQCQEYTYNCDVWSFGLVLYQLATSRQLPYKRSSSNQPLYILMQKIKNSPVPQFRPEDHRSPELCHFLSRCLQKDYTKRANVDELLQHPWIVQNSTKKKLKKFIKIMDSMIRNPQKYKKQK